MKLYWVEQASGCRVDVAKRITAHMAYDDIPAARVAFETVLPDYAMLDMRESCLPWWRYSAADIVVSYVSSEDRAELQQWREDDKEYFQHEDYYKALAAVMARRHGGAWVVRQA